jgi:hypothetical protein
MSDEFQPVGIFRASYHNWRLAMGRGMVQITVEVPIEHSDHAYQVLGGMPNPAKPVWLALARLVDGEVMPQAELAPPEPEPEPAIAAPHPAPAPPEDRPARRHWADMPPSTRAAMCCGDVRFSKWLHERGRIPEATEEAAIAYVRRVAGGSRANLGKSGHEDRTAAWEIIDRKYAEYLDELRYGGR